MRFIHTLRFRLLVGSLSLVSILFGAYSYFTIRFHSDQMMNFVLGSATRIGEVIKNSTHYSMLLNRKEDVYHIISMIGHQPGVEGIRIYNKRGEITFSTDSSEQGTVVDLHAEACTACHDQAKPLESLPSSNRTRIYETSQGYRILGMINPIRNEPQCTQSGCHLQPAERTVLGVLDVRMSLAEVDASLAEERKQLAFVSLLAVVVTGTLSIIFLGALVLRPVRILREGTQQIRQGNLDLNISLDSKTEIGDLAQSFNEMVLSLKREHEQNEQWARTLEDRVKQKSEELKRVHDQILQIEKMASLGKLSATVAHELNNPLEAILTYAKVLAKRLRKIEMRTDLQNELLNDLDLIAGEASRCGTIVKNLLLFSKKQVGELAISSVRGIVEKAEQLMRHHFAISNVRFEMKLPEQDVMILCDEQQIQQALVALFVNAVEAMPDGGTLTVEVVQESPDAPVKLSVTDTGVGIAEEDLRQIFEPFFSTKKTGVGVGLGLSVVYGIVERHGGSISVQSALSKGTTFTLSFPSPSSHSPLETQTQELSTRH
jgi:two-component system NtrC family sensor kinase